MRVSVVQNIDGIPARDWDRLAGDDNPFLRHAFLRALEQCGCVGPGTGWQPNHLTLWDAQRLVGAIPGYLKEHSFGEFVFDWAWAEAYARAGVPYYPKWISAVPFTPVTGRRLLVAEDSDPASLREYLIEAQLGFLRRQDLSSAHWLFTPAEDTQALEGFDLAVRLGCQYHWHNPGYRDFQDYLDQLKSKRRKEIRRERRQANAAGLEVTVLSGHEIEDAQWRTYHQFYCSTFDRKWGYPSLTLDFFRQLGRDMPDSVVLALAQRKGCPVAGALALRGPDALFGRHWGCAEQVPGLHFELCYYRLIDYCIRHGLRRFEAGAQGEHKITRGFEPVRTWSAHWIGHPGFRRGIHAFVQQERSEMGRYFQALASHSAYRDGASPLYEGRVLS